jgi:hypothetical protein
MPTAASAPASPPPTPSAGSGGSAVDAVAQLATEPEVLVATGVVALAGTAYVAARTAGCLAGNDTNVILTNVRLIPCLVKNGASAAGNAVGAAGAGLRQAAGTVTTAGRSTIAVLGERTSMAARDIGDTLLNPLLDPAKDGFGQGRGGPRVQRPTAVGEMLLFGLGMLVGLICAALVSLRVFVTDDQHWRTR